MLSLIAFGVIAGSQSTDFIPGTGNYTRKVTTKSAITQRYFDQGLNLLFAFNHDEARRSFLAASKEDPDCAMAYWGAAISYGPHINNPMLPASDEVAARALINKALAAKGISAAEKTLIRPALMRYTSKPSSDRSGRDRAYAEAMALAHRRSPKDADLAVFYVEAMMDLRPWDLWKPNGTPQPGTNRILAVLRDTFTYAPNHPLANHLYIHAVEASPNAYMGFDAANRLRALQPGLGHNVHMPSHIDVRSGSWHASNDANIRAIEADDAYEKSRPSQGFYRIYMAHNRHMLGFGAMMSGQGQLAIDTMDAMVERFPEDWKSQMAPFIDGWIAMPLEARVRFGRWDEILEFPEPDSRFPLSRALRHSGRAIAYAAKGDIPAANRERAGFRRERVKISPESTFGNNMSSNIAALAEQMMEGEIAIQSGDLSKGIAILKGAAKMEDNLRYDEPPSWILPIRHPLGAALLKAGRPKEAEAHYRSDLKRWPNNGWSLHGLADSLRRQSRSEEAAVYQKKFDRVWSKADTTIQSSCLCIASK